MQAKFLQTINTQPPPTNSIHKLHMAGNQKKTTQRKTKYYTIWRTLHTIWHHRIVIHWTQKTGKYHNTLCSFWNTCIYTLQERMFPKAEKVSYRALLSMLLSKFLMKMLPTPDLRMDGSRWEHMIRHGRPLIVSKFMVSKARSAVNKITYTECTWTLHIQDLL